MRTACRKRCHGTHSVYDRYTYYNRVEINRLLPIGQGMLYRKDGKLRAKFAEASIGSKAFEVDVETADIFVSAPHSFCRAVLHACLV